MTVSQSSSSRFTPGGLSDQTPTTFEEHLGERPVCIGVARRLPSFWALCDRWLDDRRFGRSSGNIARSVDLARTEVADLNTLERLKSWSESWSGRADGVAFEYAGRGDYPVAFEPMESRED